MEITISQREKRYDDKQPCFTLTVSDGEQRVSVNISRHEAYRTIDAHGLTAYDEREFDSLTEYRWDNQPPTETSDENQESTTSTPQ